MCKHFRAHGCIILQAVIECRQNVLFMSCTTSDGCSLLQYRMTVVLQHSDVLVYHELRAT